MNEIINENTTIIFVTKQKWFKEQKKLQDALNPTEKPIITIGMISLKIQVLLININTPRL